jgi:hypothetical protein
MLHLSAMACIAIALRKSSFLVISSLGVKSSTVHDYAINNFLHTEDIACNAFWKTAVVD